MKEFTEALDTKDSRRPQKEEPHLARQPLSVQCRRRRFLWRARNASVFASLLLVVLRTHEKGEWCEWTSVTR